MRYLTITEYAKEFKISRPTVYKRVMEGKLMVLPIEGGPVVIIVDGIKEDKIKEETIDAQ